MLGGSYGPLEPPPPPATGVHVLHMSMSSLMSSKNLTLLYFIWSFITLFTHASFFSCKFMTCSRRFLVPKKNVKMNIIFYTILFLYMYKFTMDVLCPNKANPVGFIPCKSLFFYYYFWSPYNSTTTHRHKQQFVVSEDTFLVPKLRAHGTQEELLSLL